MMEINISRVNNAVHFVAKNPEGNQIDLDGAEAVGGVGAGFRPMQLLLAAAGSCSAIDIVAILEKQRQTIESFDIVVKAEKQAIDQHSIWKTIHIVYKLKGNIDLAKVQKAAALSMEKYCSVSKILEPTATISFEVQVEAVL